MSDISRAERRAIVNRRRAVERRGESGPGLWRQRYLFPAQLDDEKLSDRELYDLYVPMAQASDPELASAMAAAYFRGELDRYDQMVTLQEDEDVTRLSAFFARAKLWRLLNFDDVAIEYVAALPPVASAYVPMALVIIGDLIERDDFVPPGYAAPLVLAGVSADIIVAAHMDSMPLEFASLLGAAAF